MDDKLNALITRIENSGLTDQGKAQLYTTIAAGLQGTIWPVIAKYVSEEDLKALETNPNDKAVVERYASLIRDAVDHGTALPEMEDLMNKLLDEVDAALKEEHI